MRPGTTSRVKPVSSDKQRGTSDIKLSSAGFSFVLTLNKSFNLLRHLPVNKRFHTRSPRFKAQLTLQQTRVTVDLKD